MQQNPIAFGPLGQPTAYLTQYDRNLLHPIARSRAREHLGLTTELPFYGVDMWRGYEISWLDEAGKPQIAIGEFYMPHDSTYLIESKSLKLYLNSFNQTVFEDMTVVKKTIQQDLSEAAGGAIGVKLLTPQQLLEQKLSLLPGRCLDQLAVQIDCYHVNADLLQVEESDDIITETVYSDLLKTNCLATNQPDWGSLMVRYRGTPISHASLLKYIISYREHSCFQEQCVERIFCDILARCRPQQLTVYARYTRRGGLDINPFRSNFEKLPEMGRSPRQ